MIAFNLACIAVAIIALGGLNKDPVFRFGVSLIGIVLIALAFALVGL